MSHQPSSHQLRDSANSKPEPRPPPSNGQSTFGDPHSHPSYQQRRSQRTQSNSYIGYIPPSATNQGRGGQMEDDENDDDEELLPTFGSQAPAQSTYLPANVTSYIPLSSQVSSNHSQSNLTHALEASSGSVPQISSNLIYQQQTYQMQPQLQPQNQPVYQRPAGFQPHFAAAHQPGQPQPQQQQPYHHNNYQQHAAHYGPPPQSHGASPQVQSPSLLHKVHNPHSNHQAASQNRQPAQQRQGPHQKQQSQQSTSQQSKTAGVGKAHCRGFDTRQICMKQSIMFLDLFTFKIDQCEQDPQNHNLKRCHFYHDFYKDRRRPLGTYQSEICPNVIGKGASCPKGDHCERAHNRVEEFYHPDKYKAKFCSSYLEAGKGNQQCEYQEYCSFAHSEQELSIELIEKFDVDMDYYMFLFKTVWCPYREDDHDRKVCVYAHNWQDYRRRPSIFTYSSKMCPNWQVNHFISSYSEGCPKQYQCLYSHGWKEQEYHPDFLKVKQCQHGINCKKQHCPYYHSDYDRQTPLPKWFRFFPKTRTSVFRSNYYVPSYGTKQSNMANKQTSFSSLPTQMICNQSRLDFGRGFSPDSSTRSTASTTRGGGNKSTNYRANTDGTSSQNSTNKRSKQRQQNLNTSKSNSKLSQRSSGSILSTNTPYGQTKQSQQSHFPQSGKQPQPQPHTSAAQAQQYQIPQQQFYQPPGAGGVYKESGQQPAGAIAPNVTQSQQQYHRKQMQQQNFNLQEPQVKYMAPNIVNNHFSQPILNQESHSDLQGKPATSSPDDCGLINAHLSGPLNNSPQKHSAPNTSTRSFSLSNHLSANQSLSGSASVNLSASSAQVGVNSSSKAVLNKSQTHRENSFVHSFTAGQALSPLEFMPQRFSGNDPPPTTETQPNEPMGTGRHMSTQSEDPYSLKKRTTSYGVQDPRGNSLFVSGNFGQVEDSNQLAKTNAAHQEANEVKLKTGATIFDPASQEKSPNSASVQRSLTGGGGHSGQLNVASNIWPQAVYSQGNATSSQPIGQPKGFNGQPALDMIKQNSMEESKVRNFPIEEEGSSGSCSAASSCGDDKVKGTDLNRNAVELNEDVGGSGPASAAAKKRGFLSKMKSGLKRLSIGKGSRDVSAYGSSLEVQTSVSTYAKEDNLRQSKSATLRSEQQRANSSQLNIVQCEHSDKEVLYSIKEEHQQLETSGHQPGKSQSESGQKPQTPDFILGESKHFGRVAVTGHGQGDSDQSSDQEEQKQIRLRMEDTIRDFEDDDR